MREIRNTYFLVFRSSWMFSQTLAMYFLLVAWWLSGKFDNRRGNNCDILLTDIHNYEQILQFYIHLPNWSALIPMLNDKDKLLEIWKICPLQYCSARDVTMIEVLHMCTRCRQPRFLKVRKNGDCKYLTFRWGSSQQRIGPLIHCYPSVSG